MPPTSTEFPQPDTGLHCPKCVLIVLSWTQAVPPSVGWIGFAIATAAWIASLCLKR